MPKLTDYVREGFRRRSRPWDRTELPEWWELAVWIGLAAVCGILVLGMIFDNGEPGAAQQPPAGSVAQPVTPSAPPASSPTAAAPPASSPSASDFSAASPVQVPRTGGGTTTVPAGARDLAGAAARAEATGRWSGIPVTGGAPSPSGSPSPGGRVVGDVTVEDPAVTGNGTYVFSATIARGRTTRPFLVKITIVLGGDGYAVLAR